MSQKCHRNISLYPFLFLPVRILTVYGTRNDSSVESRYSAGELFLPAASFPPFSCFPPKTGNSRMCTVPTT